MANRTNDRWIVNFKQLVGWTALLPCLKQCVCHWPVWIVRSAGDLLYNTVCSPGRGSQVWVPGSDDGGVGQLHGSLDPLLYPVPDQVCHQRDGWWVLCRLDIKANVLLSCWRTWQSFGSVCLWYADQVCYRRWLVSACRLDFTAGLLLSCWRTSQSFGSVCLVFGCSCLCWEVHSFGMNVSVQCSALASTEHSLHWPCWVVLGALHYPPLHCKACLCLCAAYHLYTVMPQLVKFVDQLTNWYVRMNRRRLKVIFYLSATVVCVCALCVPLCACGLLTSVVCVCVCVCVWEREDCACMCVWERGLCVCVNLWERTLCVCVCED